MRSHMARILPLRLASATAWAGTDAARRDLPPPPARLPCLIRHRATPWLMAVATLPALAARAGVAAGTVNEHEVKVVYHVDAACPAAADTNPGTATAPFKSIGAATAAALANKAQDVGTKILIAPGVYRESLKLTMPGYAAKVSPGSLDTAAPLVLEARQKGTVILEGADVWTGWQRAADGRTWTHPWPHRWGVVSNPYVQYGIVFPEICRRREIILVDGRPLRQVLTKEELAPGRFHVSEADGTVALCPPRRPWWRPLRIEVGTRSVLLEVGGLRNLVVRGLVFQHSPGVQYVHALGFGGVRGLVVEDCVSRWHNWAGLVLWQCDDAVVRRVQALDNGGGGANIALCRNLLVEDVETSSNNWRGAWGPWHGWDLAGIKAMYNHGAVFRRHVAAGNQCSGLWFDMDNENIRLEDCAWTGNLGLGLYFENNQGPFRIERCLAAFNQLGVVIDKSANGTLTGCTVYGNAHGQIGVQGPATFFGKNWETDKDIAARCENWTWESNVVVSTDTEVIMARGARNYLVAGVKAPLLTMPLWDYFLKTLKSSGNLWYHPLPAAAFQVGGLAYGKEPVGGLNLDEWRVVSGQDLDSLFADPRYVAPERRDFTLRPDSPLRRRAAWPRVALADTERKLPEMHPEIASYREAQRALNAPPAAGPAEEPFADAVAAPAAAWHLLDLSGVANRPLTGDAGWIGIPLTQLKPGRHTFRGVPFQVLDQGQHGGGAVVALRSASVSTGVRGRLPAQVELPVGRKARAVYILHGGGWMATHEKVAQYELLYADGSSAALPVMAYGPDASIGVNPEGIREESNIQDWWPTFPQFSHDTARSVRLEGAGADGTPCYLYVVQWLNPTPEKVIKAVCLTSDAQKKATVIVIAVTRLE